MEMTDPILPPTVPEPEHPPEVASEHVAETVPVPEAEPEIAVAPVEHQDDVEPEVKAEPEVDFESIPGPEPEIEVAEIAEDGPTPPPGVCLEVSALSDIGCVRKNNEDSYGYSESHGVYVVCDGMGGSASGEVASASAVTMILETFTESAASGMPVSTRLLQAIVAANSTVWQGGHAPQHRGMGTTVVAAALDGDKLVIGNVGDSRAYILEDGHCMQLTVDHSYVNELIRSGTLTIENAHNIDLAGMQSVITRAIGASAEVQPDFFAVDLRPGTLVLLSTDGLTRYLLQDEIVLVLNNSPYELACTNLVELAKQRGGQDNITCLLLRVS